MSPEPRRVKVKRAGHDMKCPVCGRLIRKGQEITTDGAGYPQHANPRCRPPRSKWRAGCVPKSLRKRLPENCVLCHESLPRRIVSHPGQKPVRWDGSYAHQRCVDLKDQRDMAGGSQAIAVPGVGGHRGTWGETH